MCGEGPTCEVVVVAELVEAFQWDDVAEVGRGSVSRLVSHEGLHVVLHQRGEGRRTRLSQTLDAYPGRPFFVATALEVMEEYRVERALNERDSAPLNHWSVTADALASLRERLSDAVRLRYPGEPIDRCCDAALTGLRELAVKFGYLVAEHVGWAVATELDDLARTEDWRRLVGDAWNRLLDILAEVPSADTPTDPDVLVSQAVRLADALEDWLGAIGFRIHPLPGGSEYFEVLRHDF